MSADKLANVGKVFAGSAVKSADLGKNTTVVEGAFTSCLKLTSVTLSSSATTIGITAFKGCVALTSISGMTGLKTIEKSAFEGCTALTSFSSPSTLETIGESAFSGCTKLATFTSGAATTAVGNTAFKGCVALTGFTSAAGLKTIGISAFEGCEKLATVDLSKSTVFESIGASSFKGCKALATLNMADTTKTIGASAFDGCVALKSITLKNVTKVDASAFNGCTALETANLGKVTDFEQSAFKGCIKLTTLTVDTANTKFVSDKNVIYVKSGNNMTELYMAANTLSDVVEELSPTITKIHLDYSNRVYILDAGKYNVTATSHDGATSTVFLYYMQGVKDLSSIGVSSGTFTMKYTLYSGWNPDNMTIGGVSVKPVKDNDGYTASYKYTAGKFYEVLPVGVKNLTLEDLQKADKVEGWIIKTDPKVDVVGGVITNITSFTCVILGYEGTSTSPTLKNVYVVEGLDCTVTNVTGEKGWKDMKSLSIEGDVPVASGAFTNVQTLESLTIKGMTKVSDSMFRYCTKLKTVTMDGCKTVGAYAFEGCTSMRSVDLGTVESLDPAAFSMCLEISAVKVDSKSVLKSDDLFIVRCDNADVYFKKSGNLLEIHGADGFSSFSEVIHTTGAEPKVCTIYKGGIGVLDVSGLDSIELKGTSGANSAKYLVVFDAMGGSETKIYEKSYNDSLSDIPDPVRDGYTFMGWYSYPTFDPTGDNPPIEVEKQKVTETAIYYAHWAGAESSQDLHIYVIIGAVVAIVASVAMLAYHRLR
ncbi:MAG: leucine-rich repeat protein [Candidatus Methanomethylophilaceae archaeon]